MGNTGADIEVEIAGEVAGRKAASASAGAAFEPGIEVVVVAEGMLGIVDVGAASAVVGTVRKKVGGPQM